jgi:hypothetical protein
MNSAALEHLILETLDDHWKKVAMVVAKVAQDTRFKEPQTGDDFEIIAAQVIRLVDAGRIESQGSLSDWRCAEIRLGAR